MKHITQYRRDKRRRQFLELVSDALSCIAILALFYFCMMICSALEPI
jgi:hypothetical protein